MKRRFLEQVIKEASNNDTKRTGSGRRINNTGYFPKYPQRNGYDIARATNGDEAIGALDTEELDLVITDLEMGKTSGFEVLRKAKDANFNTIAIMITGCCEEYKKEDAYRYGADDFFQKPFSVSELFKRDTAPEKIIQFHLTTTTEKLQITKSVRIIYKSVKPRFSNDNGNDKKRLCLMKIIHNSGEKALIRDNTI